LIPKSANLALNSGVRCANSFSYQYRLYFSRRRAHLRQREQQHLALLLDAVELLLLKALFLKLQLALALDLTQPPCQLRCMQAIEIQADPRRE